MAKYRVLIVEDSPTMRQLLVFALRRLRDVEIVEAQDGMDGLRKISSDHYDIALIDINMPVMDGMKLIRLIRDEETLKQIPEEYHHVLEEYVARRSMRDEGDDREPLQDADFRRALAEAWAAENSDQLGDDFMACAYGEHED